MKNIIIGLLLTVASSSFAQSRNEVLFDKIQNSGILCDSQSFMLDFALDELRRSPNNESYKRELAGAKVDLARCVAAAAAIVQPDCKASITKLLEKNLVCSAETAMLEAADVMYKMNPSSRNARELADAQENLNYCIKKGFSLCIR